MKRFVQASVIGLALGLSGCGGASEPDVGAPVAPPVAAASEPEPEATVPIREERTIVMLGDSLTAGYGLAPEQALPEQLAHRLTAAGLKVEMVNAGVSGDTSTNGRDRYDWSVASAQPQVLIIALGANDYLLGLNADTTRANIAALIERAQRENIQVILAGLEPRSDAPAGSRDAAFAAIYPELAATYSVALYPALLQGVRDVPELLQSDGLHPTAAGIEVVADQFSVFLAEELARE